MNGITTEGKIVLSFKKIILARAKSGLNIAALAEKYGCSRQRMQILLNSRNVTPTCAGRLAKALGVDVTEIIED